MLSSENDVRDRIREQDPKLRGLRGARFRSGQHIEIVTGEIGLLLALNRFERSNAVVDAVKLQHRLLKKVAAKRNAVCWPSHGLLLKLLGDVFDGGVIRPNLERA